MDHVLSGLSDFALPYLDDVAVFSDTWDEHIQHLIVVFDRLRKAGLTVRPEKCQLGSAEVSYLGHVVGQGLRRPLDVKIAAVVDYPRPQNKSDVRAFLGLCGYYQHYVHNYSQVAGPLTDALRKNEPRTVKWDETKENSFQELKKALTCKPVLASTGLHSYFHGSV